MLPRFERLGSASHYSARTPHIPYEEGRVRCNGSTSPLARDEADKHWKIFLGRGERASVSSSVLP